MNIFKLFENVSVEVFLLVVLYLVITHVLKKDKNSITNKEIYDRLESMETGYLKTEVLKEKIQYFVKQVRWRSQNELKEIIRKNNIDKNIERTEKKIENIYFSNEIEMNEMLNDICSESTLNHIIDIFKQVSDENKNDISTIIDQLKKEHTKAEEEKAITELNVEMNKFEKKVVKLIKDSL